MKRSQANPVRFDPAEWVMIFLSWMIYLGGMVFFSEGENNWAVMALGALPVLVTAWSLGMLYGIGAALLSTAAHLALRLLRSHPSSGMGELLFEQLIGFSLLAITGMFVGHLRELQQKSRSELLTLTENNQKLLRLSKALEATSRLSTELVTGQNWLTKIPDLLKKISTAAEIDHLFLLQLTGKGTKGCLGKSYHHWSEIQTQYPGEEPPRMPAALRNWIDTAHPDQPISGSLADLEEEVLDYFYLRESGQYAIFPIFTSQLLWGFIGFETFADQDKWDTTELGTFQNIAQTLGAIVYKKRIEDNLDLRAKELDSLQKTSLNLSSTDHLESGLQGVMAQIYKLTPAYDTNIYLYRNKEPVFYLSLGKNGQQTLPHSHPGEEKISLLTAQSSQDYYISNLTAFNDIDGFTMDQKEALISYPLKAASEVIGVLNIWFPGVRTFSPEEKTILRLLADQAATAIISMQYLQAEREQRILADSLRKANLQLSDNLELKGVLKSILKQVLNMVAARDAQIFLYDGEALEFGAVIYSNGVQPDPVYPPGKDSVFYQTAQKGERILIRDLEKEDSRVNTWKSGALASLPLIFHRDVIGVMNVSFVQPGELDEGLLQVLDLLSNQAAIAINNARTFEAERKQRKLAQALQKTGRAIQSSLELDVVLDQILEQIATVIEYDSANLILLEEGSARVVRQIGFRTENKENQPEPASGQFDINRFSTLASMTENKQPLIIPDVKEYPAWVETEGTQDVLSWAGAPILNRDQVVGFLSLNSRVCDFYQPEHAEILTAFAGQASIALHHARLHKEIQELAITDPLTNILNRRGLDRWGQYEINRAKRFNSTLSAIFFDLDNFKHINDTYGHDAGDDLLCQIVDHCQQVIRKIDIFARIGGEEFLIILPETALPIAFHVAERLRKTVANQEYEVNAHTVSMTISLGVVELSQETDSLAELISAADQYMYRAKEAGRNRTAYPTS